jgi:hypothetical protein
MRAGVAAQLLSVVSLASGCLFAPCDMGGPPREGLGGFGGGGIGGTPPPAGTGGVSGSAGSAGSAGDSGTPDPCPDGNPNCSAQSRRDLCSTLVACDAILGSALTEARCFLEIDARCADCLSDTAAQDGGVDDSDCSLDLSMDCAHRCNLLIAPPQDEVECLAIASGQPGTTPEYDTCLCDQCLDEYAACIEDDGCWLVQQCVFAVGCDGQACNAPDTCMAIIGEIGATSISVARAAELGNCTEVTCDALRGLAETDGG